MYNRVLTIQDISCVGQCSSTVALPIISACGQETAVLPSAVLSSHTAFNSFSFRDLTDDIPNIKSHWQNEKILFNAIYTGYLGSLKQIEYVTDIMKTMGTPDAVKIVDPAMGDNGKLYSNFDTDFAHSMAALCKEADIIIPNITEASYMTDIPYKDSYDEAYINSLLDAMKSMGMKKIILTGVSYEDNTTGVIVCENDKVRYYKHEKLAKNSPGTGDVFASAFVGAYVSGKDLFEAVQIAADFVLQALKNTQSDENHWYGVKFETCLGMLIEALK